MKTVVFPVVGVTFDNRQERLEKFYRQYKSGGRYPVALFAEDDNHYDPNAVAVYLEVEGNLTKVGYISREYNVEVRKMMLKLQDSKVASMGPNQQGQIGFRVVVETAD